MEGYYAENNGKAPAFWWKRNAGHNHGMEAPPLECWTPDV